MGPENHRTHTGARSGQPAVVRAAVMTLVAGTLRSAPSAAGVQSSGPGPRWELYRPTLVRSVVVDGDRSRYRYNHCSAIARYGGRWFCLWNGNTVPIEGRPGQRILQSTSADGRTWSPPAAVFEDPHTSHPPIPARNGVQWQPNLIVIDGELWAFWSHFSKDDLYGCYFSRLTRPSGRWRHRRLEWEGGPDALISGHRYRVVPVSAPVRLRTGRILVPVVLIGRRQERAPRGVTGWAALEKRCSVLYSDDHGRSWKASAGTIQPGLAWAQWEPTVWEADSGVVRMVARNEAPGAPPTRALLAAESHDGGVTWTPLRPVPIPTASSRMHVRTWQARTIMVHNDWPGDADVGRRFNLALFFNRGSGPDDFVPGPGISAVDPAAAYPCMWLEGRSVMVTYSAGFPPRSIRAVLLRPLPSARRRYVFPRTNAYPGPAPPEFSGNCLRFYGWNFLDTRRKLPAPGRFSLVAWVKGSRGVILDARGIGAQARRRSGKGFVFCLKRNRPVLFPGSPEGDLTPRLDLRWHEWNFIALAADLPTGQVMFEVNGRREIVHFTPSRKADDGALRMRVGYKAFAASSLPGFRGAIGFLAYHPGVLLTPDQIAALGREHRPGSDRAGAAGLGPPRAGRAAPVPSPALALDALSPHLVTSEFAAPDPPELHVSLDPSSNAARRVLRIPAGLSAGLDLDPWKDLSGRGLRLSFRFRCAIRGPMDEPVVLCTAGNADRFVRLMVRRVQEENGGPPGAGRTAGRESWEMCVISTTRGDAAEPAGEGGRAAERSVRVGDVDPGRWTRVSVRFADDRVSVGVDGRAGATAGLQGIRPVPVFLGDAYPRRVARGDAARCAALLIDLSSLTVE